MRVALQHEKLLLLATEGVWDKASAGCTSNAPVEFQEGEPTKQGTCARGLVAKRSRCGNMMERMMRRRNFLSTACLPFAGGMADGLTSTRLEAGAAKRLITPDPLLLLSGGLGSQAPVNSKQGEWMVRDIAVRSSDELLGIVSVDLLGFPAVLGDRARKHVPRITAENILIGATHTHSAPDSYAFPDGKGGHTGPLAYLSFVVEQLGAALNEALDGLQAAELRVGSGEAKGKIAYNFYVPNLYDWRVGVFELRRVEGHGIATLVNYAIHPELMGNAQGILSPDLVGPLCDTGRRAGW